MTDSDPFNLNRFVEVQAHSYTRAFDEIRRGQKRSHWMWYVFPQVSGLGTSEMAREFAIRSIAEAAAYLAHPVLGVRYIECVEALQDLPQMSAEDVFGDVDAMKLQSSLTLFENAEALPVVAAAIDRWFGGKRDAATLAILTGLN